MRSKAKHISDRLTVARFLTGLVLLLLLYLVTPPAFSIEDPPEYHSIRIGVLAFRGSQHAIKKWSPTVNYLGEVLPDYLFQIVPLDLGKLEKATRDNKLDFIITNPGNYVSLEARYGASRIATLENSHRDTTYTRYGAVIISKKSRSDIRSLKDLRGKSFMAISPHAFGGYQMAWLQMRKAGIDPERDFKEIRYSGFPQDIVVNAILSNEVDAGTVRAETLARMGNEGKISLADINVLNAQRTPGYPFTHSTGLYPEWAFAKLKNTSGDIAKAVTIALLNYDRVGADNSKDYTWTIPLDYSPVHELFRTLQIGPYNDLGKITLSAVLKKYLHWIVLVVISLIVLIIVTSYVVSINRRLAHSRQQLTEHQQVLEQKVSERTEELRQSNLALKEDIVIRKHAEEALRKSKVILQSIHEITIDHTLTFNEKLSALLKAGCQHFNLSDGRLSKIIGSQYQIILHYNANKQVFERGEVLDISETICNLTVKDSGTLVIRASDIDDPEGQVLFERKNLQCYFGVPVFKGNELFGTLCFSSDTDITGEFESVDHDILQLMAQWIGDELERQHAQEVASLHQSELEHAARLGTLGELASGLAHELNQPLTAITNYLKGFQRRMGDGPVDGESVNPIIHKVIMEAERAAMIIKHMREFIQKRELEHESVNLEEVVENAVSIVRSADTESKIDYPVNVNGECVVVNADRIQLEQVFINLLNNAREALQGLSRQGLIRIDIHCMEQDVIVDVIDNGTGVSEKFLANIFLPFETTKHNGLGLGLSISRTIVESLQGSIAAKNLPGGGLKMSIRLPCEA